MRNDLAWRGDGATVAQWTIGGRLQAAVEYAIGLALVLAQLALSGRAIAWARTLNR